MASVVCAPEAAIPIKCMSPEILVYPVLGTDLSKGENEGYFERILGKNDIFICGPGLGNDVAVVEDAKRLVQEVISRQLPLIIDGVK